MTGTQITGTTIIIMGMVAATITVTIITLRTQASVACSLRC